MQDRANQFLMEALLNLKKPSEISLSPDGRYVAYVIGTGNKANKDTPPDHSLYVIELGSKQTHRLSVDGTSATEPCWSPDGQTLAFVSTVDKVDEAQLCTVSISGGEARVQTDLRGIIKAPRWFPDGRTIVFLYAGTADPQPRIEPDPIVMYEMPEFDRVWLIDSVSQDMQAISPETCHVFEYALSHDGKRLVMMSSSHHNPAEAWYSAQLHVLNLITGEIHQLCTMPHQIGRLVWSPDDRQIGFVSGIMSDQGNISGEVYIVPADGGEAECITPGIDFSITWIAWRTEGIIYGGRDVDSSIVGLIDADTGKIERLSQGLYAINGHGPQSISIAKDGRFVALCQSFTEAPNIYLSALQHGEWERLSALDIDQKMFPPLHVESRHWQSADGTPVQGFLVYPQDYQEGEQYPMFVHVHGGPSWSYLPTYLGAWERLISARNCFVLMPNPRGSWGRGLAYQTANVGDLGGGDWQDIEAGIDTIIAEGLVDPDRLAIGGWSYGGYLVAWGITQTDRFRCAIVGASITNYESNYGVVSNREWQTTMFASNVYDDYELHRSRSPIAFASQVKTPTLLLHGEEDKLAPVQQGIEFFVALKHFGVPAQLVIYPREPHGFQEHAHQIDLYQRIGIWLDKYLLS